LYEEVILFINKAGFSWEMDQSGDIHWLRKSNQNIVNAINSSILMQKNLATFAMSSNQEMKEAYTKIRVELTLLIRKLETVRLETDADDTAFSLDYLDLLFEEHISDMNKWLAVRIKKESITAEMAASLMNDVSNATNIYRNLVEMGEMLFVKHHHNMSDAERSIQLNQDDLNEIKEQMKNN
jgi:phosphate:Na+ symporter